MNTFNLTLDLNKSRASSPVRLRQGDKSGTTISALILDHGATANLTGMTAQLVMELPDGTQYYRKSASVSGNVVTVVVDESTAASVTGRTANAYFQLLQGTTVKASTGSFVVEILPDALEGHTVPENYDSAIQDAIDALDDAVEQLPATVEDVLADHPEWTTTVQDGSITKAKLATDLARDRERLLYRLDNLLTNALPEGETATATDAARTPMAGLALYGRSMQDGTPTPSSPVAIESVTGNVLPNNGSSVTTSGVTFTRNADGSVTCRGTNTSSGAVHYTLTDGRAQSTNKVTIPDGTYTFCVSVDGTGIRAEYLSLMNAGTVVAQNLFFLYGSGSSTKSMVGYDYDGMHCGFYIGSGVTVDATIRIAIYHGSAPLPYVPYGYAGLWAKRTSDASVYTVTPIDLDGHELRSLPDGTRDEVTVDQYGHAVLTQRVGVATLVGAGGAASEFDTTNGFSLYAAATNMGLVGIDHAKAGHANLRCDKLLPVARNRQATNVMMVYPTGMLIVNIGGSYANAQEAAAAVTALHATVLYPLATPVTHDLGYVAAVPLVGPDLTAQAIPTAPFALTYERDLNTTLARLESAIATLA